ncbi:MAG: sporulation protein [Oscillibacter sp.]
MKKISWRTPLCLLSCMVLLWFLADAAGVREAVSGGLRLCAQSVVPALFPFLVVTTLLLRLGLGELLSPLFSGLMTPLFRLPGTGASALLLGLIGGYPVGAKTAAELYAAGLLTRDEGERLLAFCNNANPVFLISVLGVGVFGSVRAGVWLWLIHVVSALLTGLLFRGGGKPTRRQSPPPIPLTVPFSVALVDAVRSALAGMLSVCAFVVFFYVLVQPLAGLGGRVGTLLVGVTELFSVIPLLEPSPAGFVLAAGLAGWGGLSVLCQTAAVLDGSGLSPRNALPGKLLQALLSVALALPLAGYAL